MPAMTVADKNILAAINTHIDNTQLALKSLEKQAKVEENVLIQRNLRELCLGMRSLLKHLQTTLITQGFYHPENENYRIDTDNVINTLAWLNDTIRNIRNNPSVVNHADWQARLESGEPNLSNALHYRPTAAFLAQENKKRHQKYSLITGLVVFLVMGGMAALTMGIALAVGAVAMGVLSAGIFGAAAGCAISIPFVRNLVNRFKNTNIRENDKNRNLILNAKTPLPNLGQILLATNNITREYQAQDKQAADIARKIALENEKAERQLIENQQREAFYQVDENGKSDALMFLRPRIEYKYHSMHDELSHSLRVQYVIQEFIDEKMEDPKQHAKELAYLEALKDGIELKVELLSAQVDAYRNIEDYTKKKIAKYTQDPANKRPIVDALKGYAAPKYGFEKKIPFKPLGDYRYHSSSRPSHPIFSYGDHRFYLFTPLSKKISAQLHEKNKIISRLKPNTQ